MPRKYQEHSCSVSPGSWFVFHLVIEKKISRTSGYLVLLVRKIHVCYKTLPSHQKKSILRPQDILPEAVTPYLNTKHALFINSRIWRGEAKDTTILDRDLENRVGHYGTAATRKTVACP